MKTFGLTGGIGMGKSTAADWLQRRGLPVIDTDQLAREIVEPGQPALREIQQAFGNDVVGEDGRLRRDELARRIFGNAAARQVLEHITHPRIRELWNRQVNVWAGEGLALAVVVIPLLFETGADADLDVVVCVACSAATQARRLRERGWTAEEARQRIAAQWPVETKMSRADYVVWSEGSREVFDAQLERIFRV